MNEQTKWTEADFDEMSWHDCQVNSIAFDQDGEWQSDLVLDLVFIVEWLCGADKRCRFRVAPAVLRFTNVNNLRFDLSLKFKQPLQVYSVERTDISTTGYKNYHWVIKVHNYPGMKDNLIKFDATGFTQILTGRPLEKKLPNLTTAERKKARNGWQTSA